jgi:hypothetical protein
LFKSLDKEKKAFRHNRVKPKREHARRRTHEC